MKAGAVWWTNQGTSLLVKNRTAERPTLSKTKDKRVGQPRIASRINLSSTRGLPFSDVNYGPCSEHLCRFQQFCSDMRPVHTNESLRRRLRGRLHNMRPSRQSSSRLPHLKPSLTSWRIFPMNLYIRSHWTRYISPSLASLRSWKNRGPRLRASSGSANGF